MRWIRYIIIVLVCGILISNLPIIHASDQNDTRIVIGSYFEALKNGDVQTILNMLTDPLLGAKRGLLENNTAYPAYLKNYYENATMVIKEINYPKENMQIVKTEIIFTGDIHSMKSQFILKNVDGAWKISQEMNEP